MIISPFYIKWSQLCFDEVMKNFKQKWIFLANELMELWSLSHTWFFFLVCGWDGGDQRQLDHLEWPVWRAIGIAPLECRSCCYLLPYHYIMSLPRIRVVVAHSLGHSWKFVIVVQGAEYQVIVASLPLTMERVFSKWSD